MDNKRLLVFGVLALALFFGWEAWLKSRYPEMYATPNASAPAAAQKDNNTNHTLFIKNLQYKSL